MQWSKVKKSNENETCIITNNSGSLRSFLRREHLSLIKVEPQSYKNSDVKLKNLQNQIKNKIFSNQ